MLIHPWLALLAVLPAFAQTEAEFEARRKALSEQVARECPGDKATPACDRLRLELREAETNLKAVRSGPGPGVEVRGHEDVTVEGSAPPVQLLPTPQSLATLPGSTSKPANPANAEEPKPGAQEPAPEPQAAAQPPADAHVCFRYRSATDAKGVREGLRGVPAEDKSLASYTPLSAGLAYSCENPVAGQQGTQMYRENCELGNLRKKVDSFCMERRNRRTAQAKQEYEEIKKIVDSLTTRRVDPALGLPVRVFGQFQKRYALDARGADLPQGKPNEIRDYALEADIVVDSYVLALTKPESAKQVLDSRCQWPEPKDKDSASCVRRLAAGLTRTGPQAAVSGGQSAPGMSPAAKAAVAGAAAGFAAGAVAGRMSGGGGRESEDRCEDSKANLDACLKDKPGDKKGCCKYVRGKDCKRKLGCQ